VGALQPVHAQEETDRERLEELKARFRRLEVRHRLVPAPKGKRIQILREMANIGSESAFRYVAGVARDPRHADILRDVLELLVKAGPESNVAAGIFSEHLKGDDPFRTISRDYLLSRAIRRSDEQWLQRLFESEHAEDRFLALDAMRNIVKSRILDSAWSLLRDPTWKPGEGSKVSCGTIAASLKGFEGSEAAKVLLLLQRDERFNKTDAQAVREATRLWARRNLRDYIEMAELAHPDPRKREESARFMGGAGIEAARAPLLKMAESRWEEPRVRAAAVRSLGKLKIARGDLARRLTALLKETDPRVRRSVIASLGELKVRGALVALAGQLNGAHDLAARAALVDATGLPQDTDWKAWVESEECGFPSGT
jgi:HEAT repeat protein